MPVKQVIVLRKDLNMRKGKMAAQAAHASLLTIIERIKLGDDYTFDLIKDEAFVEWFANDNFAKIVVGCDSEEELLEINNKAIKAGLPRSLVQDLGRTEFKGKLTFTAVAIGPAESEIIDSITGHLKLL
jgi:PTH2 family peptidyl-tRNA hydrolase